MELLLFFAPVAFIIIVVGCAVCALRGKNW